MSVPFVWTEIFNCAKIGKAALKSYVRFHRFPVHVYGYAADLAEVPDHPLIIKEPLRKASLASRIKYHSPWCHSVLSEAELKRAFRSGHRGTALLWAHIIKSQPADRLIHFDSDVIFLGDVLSGIDERLRDAQLVGPIRNYKNNRNGVDEVRHLPDVVQTLCFGFRPEGLRGLPFDTLCRMVQGVYNPLGHMVIDFFDPVSFLILQNGGKVGLLPHDEVGGENGLGSRQNSYALINDFPTPNKLDFGSKLIHFSAVGSGMHFFHDTAHTNVPDSYKQYAIDRYALYCKAVLGEDIGVPLDSYALLIKELSPWLTEIR